MFAIIYSFQVKPNHEDQFEKAWRDMTALIAKHEGGLGSRLHKQDEFRYIAYAQWPDRAARDNTGGNLPKEDQTIRKAMRDACEKVETQHEMEMIDDMLMPI